MGGAIFVFVLLLLSLIMGYRLGKNLARPIERMGAIARDIRAGDLGARIQLPPAHHREIQQLADNLDRTFAQLQQLYDQASEFSGNAAHELRTPLTALRGKIEVALRADRSAEDYQATLCDCMDDIAALQKIIDALLLLSRPTDHWGSQAFSTIDLSAVCRQVVEPYQAMAAESDIRINLELEPDLHITAIEQFIHQLLSNLLHNAVKFSPPGSQISLSAERSDDCIRLRIADQGIGMTADTRARIFDRFYQADTSRNIGTGLGLALVKYIADLHRAPILVESAPDRGTTFTLDFPPADEADD